MEKRKSPIRDLWSRLTASNSGRKPLARVTIDALLLLAIWLLMGLGDVFYFLLLVIVGKHLLFAVLDLTKPGETKSKLQSLIQRLWPRLASNNFGRVYLAMAASGIPCLLLAWWLLGMGDAFYLFALVTVVMFLAVVFLDFSTARRR